MEASVTSLIRKRPGPLEETPDSRKVCEEGSAARKVMPKQFFGYYFIWKEEGRDWKHDVEAVIVEEEEITRTVFCIKLLTKCSCILWQHRS